jgi:hypothetical protein
MNLGEHLDRAAREPWQWGISDCSTFPADWILSLSGVDPMNAWRGGYATESEACEIITKAGGLAELFAHGIDPVWPRAEGAGEGAVGVISLRGDDGIEIDVGAVHTGRRWAVRSPRGIALITQPLAVRAIWAR